MREIKLKRFIVFTMVVMAVLLLNHFIRLPRESDFMRGKRIAHDMGCVGCHQPVTNGVIMNPSSLRGVIPNFHSGLSTSLFWVESRDEFEEWVKQGASNRIMQERLRFKQQDTGMIVMPAYGSVLGHEQISDLYRYFRDTNYFPRPPEGAASRGAHLADQHGCFACHGQHGLDGISNAGSFKGYIPPWSGEDFNELAHSDDELREWIKTGHLRRFNWNPFAMFFLKNQKIKMPAYEYELNDDEINDLVAYIRWLPERSLQQTEVVADDMHGSNSDRGRNLFNQSGCSTCHKPKDVEGFLDRRGVEIPSRLRLASRLRALAAIILEREKQSRWNAPELCGYYNNFYQEYNNVHKLIQNGIDKESGAQQQLVMPPWAQRANASLLSYADRDIDALVDFLLMDNLSITDNRIAEWKKMASSCVANKHINRITNHETRRKQIMARIDALDRQGQLFEHSPSATFLSREAALFDIVGFYADQELDLWLLRQYPSMTSPVDISKRLSNPNGFPKERRYVIAVDKTNMDYSAYFFVGESAIDFNNPPVYFTSTRYVDAAVSGCFGCHMSGPRKIRPLQREGMTDLDNNGLALVQDFNNRILGYGAVETVWPANQQKPDKHLLEVLTVDSCNRCHQSASIRAPILRYHQRSVATLLQTKELDNGFVVDTKDMAGDYLTAMPPVAPVKKSNKADIQTWMSAK